ncbi:MAG: tetratricopeptide repeat protein [Gammaproteobacteria bacterium]|nr:tetratricopeptide repeat protein [Pseudomonadales bacterium]MCP5345247.1 tetratricopeptide repeat protein [Pseudomonadales bacterium]
MAAGTSPPARSAPEPEPAIDYGAFSEEQLYQAIVSELSGQSGDLEQASDNYYRLAFETRDVAIVRRASQFAAATGDINAMVQLGLLWTELEPENVDPHLLLSFQLLDAGRFEDAVRHMAQVIELGGEMDFATLSARSQRLPAARRSRLIESLRQLHEQYPEQQSIQYAVVELLSQNQQPEDALVELQILRQNYGESPRALLTESRLLQTLEQPDRALRVLRNGVREFPDEKPLRFGYARLLIQQEDFEQAHRQFEIIIEQDPEDYEVIYSTALLDMELENYDQAMQRLQQLITAGHRVSDCQFYLGYIHEQLEQPELAIPHYRAVDIGASNFVAAQQQATRFAMELGRFDEAHDWLVELSRGQPRLEVVFTNVEANLLMQMEQYDRAAAVLEDMLQRYPNDTDLLFTRVLLHDNLGDMDSAERDLRRIITLQPDDYRALNHLGYMLADRTDRYQEALELLERAASLAPDDPAVIDSLAWVQYKLGRYQESLQNLRRAFAAFPDHEVASHLGEVLWAMGREQEAMEVWEDALKETPDSPIIGEAMQRLTR